MPFDSLDLWSADKNSLAFVTDFSPFINAFYRRYLQALLSFCHSPRCYQFISHRGDDNNTGVSIVLQNRTEGYSSHFVYIMSSPVSHLSLVHCCRGTWATYLTILTATILIPSKPHHLVRMVSVSSIFCINYLLTDNLLPQVALQPSVQNTLSSPHCRPSCLSCLIRSPCSLRCSPLRLCNAKWWSRP